MLLPHVPVCYYKNTIIRSTAAADVGALVVVARAALAWQLQGSLCMPEQRLKDAVKADCLPR